MNVANLGTQQLSDSYGTESSAPRIEVAAICDLSKFFVIVLIASQQNAELQLILNKIKYFCNGTVWGSVTIIGTCAVTCTSSCLRDWQQQTRQLP